ncbi:ParB/RepB/Spo0J family partition protein [Reyranella soli]|uniref:Chromosome partitioning protein ParB n=1 Tax=Reyranella soli TaxID=1230389 RepID=A0A512NQ59_9HYPH|nr:ParB/RepB/Spo0J family partition protein [Reyranella soli]GEP61085.1 chromosome partitioning protein ParB [Reyranella soli]
MSLPPKPRGLGRGLSALLGDDEVAATVAPAPAPPPPSVEPPAAATRPAPARAPLTLPIGQLKAGRMQPRTTFEDMDALVESVKEFGLLQPILVRPVAGQADAYEIVAGERRWRAAQKAQLHEVPVVLRNMGDQDALQLGLIENLQRSDLTAIDEALGYRRLSDEFKQTQEDISKTVGKSRPHVANTVRLLDLPGAVQDMIRRGDLSAGQARALIGVPDPLVVAQRAIDEKLTARDLERLGGELKSKTKNARPKANGGGGGKSADTKALEKRIEEALGLKADLKLRGLGEQSLLTLEIRDFDQLDTVVERLTRR